ncbi:mechanosensitive ion channel [bacterium]|nr:mechanosensitive ion channel [bacterium]
MDFFKESFIDLIGVIKNWTTTYFSSWSVLLEIAWILLAIFIPLWVSKKKLKSLSVIDIFQDKKPLLVFFRGIKKHNFLFMTTISLYFGITILHFFDFNKALLTLFSHLSIAWLSVKLISYLIKNRLLSKIISYSIWVIIFLNLIGILDIVTKFLEKFSIDVGTLHISVYMIIKGSLFGLILFQVAGILSEIFSDKIKDNEDISLSYKVLFVKIVKLILYLAAFFLALAGIGINPTSLAVFSGAIGLGLGFGLQKIVSNLISGFMLLLDDSIKPKDIIEMPDGSFGTVQSLGARYVLIKTPLGKEILIPNESMITKDVIKWTHTDSKIVVILPIGVSYNSDLNLVKEILLESTIHESRILREPEPVAILSAFGNSSVDFELVFWIADPENGTKFLKSNLYFYIWNRFKENNIEIPFPQVDVHMR